MTDHPRLSRREFVRGRFLAALLPGRVNPPAEAAPPPGAAVTRHPAPGAIRPSRRPPTLPILRPPGAVHEASFLAGCTRCNACADACPYDAIERAPIRFREAAGTPMIDPARQPCWMCADTPCISACEPGVLALEQPRTMGTARIDEQSCLAYQGTFCSVCAERCPVEGVIETTKGRPRITETACSGCGVCHYTCPAPTNAVIVMPMLTRPGRVTTAGEGLRP